MEHETRDRTKTKAALLAVLCMAAIVALFAVHGCGSDSGGAGVAGGGQPATAANGGDTNPAGAGGDQSGGDPAAGNVDTAGGGAADGPINPDDAPLQGEGLKRLDWRALFDEDGDGWKQYAQELVFNNGAEPETLDPALMTGVPEHTLALALFEGLTTHHPRTLQPLPGVAEWWELSPDGLTYTFHLRANAKWSNGDPVTAEDFQWSWHRALDPATASQYAYQYYAIKNAEAFNKKQITDFSQVGIRVADAHTFVVTLAAPTPYFLDLTSFETLMPVHRATVEKHGDAWIRPEHFVGNGPFILKAWKPRDEIVMTPNAQYWNKGVVRLTRIRAKALDDMNTAYNTFKAGEVDWLRAVPLDRIEEVQRHPDYFAQPYLGTYFYRFNVTKKPFDDVRVRHAFNLAVDKASLCTNVMKAGQIPATGYVPPGIHGYQGITGPAYDPERAKALMAEAGYPGGKGFPEVELLYNTSESHKRVAEVISNMWKDTLGIVVKLRNSEWKVYLDDVDNLRYQVARAGWIGDYTDPNTFMDMFVTGGGNNSTGWSNAEYDRLIKAAALEQDPAKRAGIFQAAEKILCVDGLPILPIYFYVNTGMLRQRVQGIAPNIRDLHPFQFVWIDGPPAKDD